MTSDLNAALAATRGTTAAYDGLAEIWWDSVRGPRRARRRARRASAPDETLTEDEARFIDFERSSLFLAEEHAIFER